MIVLVPKLAQLARDYPDVVLDLTTDNSGMDLVAAGFDAGIEIGEFIQKDMVAVRVSEDLRAAIVGSPKYFASRPKPKHPRDLLNHACINFRQGSRGMYQWEFEKGKESLAVAVDGPLIVNDAEKAKQVLKENGFTVGRTSVVAVLVPDRPGGLHSILEALSKENINVEYMYAFVERSGEHAIIIFRFNATDRAIDILTKSGFTVLPGDKVYSL
jgi:DNA-binding transcriptional LysR family regulator